MNFALRLLLLVCCLLLSCCIMQQRMSVLSDVPLHRSLKVAVDGYYIAPNPERRTLPARGTVYVAPMDVTAVKGSADECLPAMQENMHRYLCEEIDAALRDVCPAGEWTRTDDAAQATLIYRTALVRFRRQRPVLRGLAVIAGPFVDVPLVSDAVKRFAKGDICIEGTVSYRPTNALIAAFRDANRESTAFYEVAAYRPTGHVEANLRIWAKKMARLIYANDLMERRGESFEEVVKERSVGDTLKAYLE